MTAQPLTFLLITATFPPRGGSSVQRAAKFAKYAKRAGHEPVVITSNYFGPFEDPSLAADLPEDLQVIRTGRDPATYGPIVRRIVRKLYPTAHAIWARRARRAAERELGRRQFDAIFVSFGAPSALLIGAKLSRKFDLPLVLDIRDMWTVTAKKTRRNRPGTWLGRVDRVVERRAWKAVDHFTVVSNGYRETMIEEYGIAPDRVTTVYNGFDPEDFGAGTKSPQSEYPTIRFAGFVTEVPAFAQLVTAVGQVNERRQATGQPLLRFQIIGGNNRAKLAAALRGAWPPWLDLIGYRPHREAVHFMQQATMLALFQPADKGMLTGKFFEYVGSGRPILHLDNQTEELKDLITGLNLGHSVPQTDTQAIASAIEGLLSGNNDVSRAPPAEFRRDFQAEQFLGIMQDIVVSQPKNGLPPA